MDTRSFTEQESMAVIAEMIERARNNFRRGSGNSMIYWGCWCVFTTLLVFVLLKTLSNPNQAFWAWSLMAVAGIVEIFVKRKNRQKLLVKTQIDTIIASIWHGYMFFCCLFLAIIFTLGFAMKDFNIFALITPVILSAVGMAEFATAKACRFKWYLYGAVGMWLGAVACVTICLLKISVAYHMPVLAVCMFFGFVVTGILQNKKADKNHV